MLDFSLIWFSANHFIKPCQKQDVSLHDQNKWKRDSFSVLQKVQISFSLMPILFRTSFVAKRLWSSLNWKVINLVALVL